MATIFLADEFLFTDIDDQLGQFEPLPETDYQEIHEFKDAQPNVPDLGDWHYQILSPGVRCYYY